MKAGQGAWPAHPLCLAFLDEWVGCGWAFRSSRLLRARLSYIGLSGAEAPRGLKPALQVRGRTPVLGGPEGGPGGPPNWEPHGLHDGPARSLPLLYR